MTNFEKDDQPRDDRPNGYRGDRAPGAHRGGPRHPHHDRGGRGGWTGRSRDDFTAQPSTPPEQPTPPFGQPLLPGSLRGFPGFGGPTFTGFGDGFGPRAGGERRAPRGSVNIALLDLLLEGESNGYGLMQKFSARTSGRWAPQSGTIYPALGKLVQQQLVAVTDEGVYSLTPSGRLTAEKSHDSVRQLFDHMGTEEAASDLFGAGRKLMGALWQLYTQGSSEQQAKVAEQLDELRKDIYRRLSE